ncbi:uncharacterized protein [Amphiura filiformis]|uniref:uncharacterized protein n=1 Tax=Amphiura filiformis TaxID=82378 RepID=UPI003B223996
MADKDSAGDSDSTPIRIFLWGIPRSLSTVFEKCLSHMPNIQIISEPYTYAYYFGPESKVWQASEAKNTKAAMEMGETVGMESKPGWFHESICTYKWAKETLEAAYPGKSVIFTKEIAHAITGHRDMLATGFRHTFLIRHPHKVFPSWTNMTKDFLQMDEKTFQLQDMTEPHCPPKYGYGELYDLMQYVQTNHGESCPINIDADDLQSSPASILRQYCDALGIPFNDCLLQWPAGIDILDQWIVNSTLVAVNKTSSGGFYEAAFNSTHFLPPSKVPSRQDVAEDLLPLIDDSMPYYEKLYQMRIRP